MPSAAEGIQIQSAWLFRCGATLRSLARKKLKFTKIWKVASRIKTSGRSRYSLHKKSGARLSEPRILQKLTNLLLTLHHNKTKHSQQEDNNTPAYRAQSRILVIVSYHDRGNNYGNHIYNFNHRVKSGARGIL